MNATVSKTIYFVSFMAENLNQQYLLRLIRTESQIFFHTFKFVKLQRASDKIAQYTIMYIKGKIYKEYARIYNTNIT